MSRKNFTVLRVVAGFPLTYPLLFMLCCTAACREEQPSAYARTPLQARESAGFGQTYVPAEPDRKLFDDLREQATSETQHAKDSATSAALIRAWSDETTEGLVGRYDCATTAAFDYVSVDYNFAVFAGYGDWRPKEPELQRINIMPQAEAKTTYVLTFKAGAYDFTMEPEGEDMRFVLIPIASK